MGKGFGKRKRQACAKAKHKKATGKKRGTYTLYHLGQDGCTRVIRLTASSQKEAFQKLNFFLDALDLCLSDANDQEILNLIESWHTPTPEKLQEFVADFIKTQYGDSDLAVEPTFPDQLGDKTLSIFLKGSECGWIYLTDDGIRVSDAFLESEQQEIIQAVESRFGSRVLCFSSGNSLYIEGVEP